MTTYFVPHAEIQTRLSEGRAGPVIAASPTRHLAWLDASVEDVRVEMLSRPRAAQSAKGFFMPPAESVGRYGEGAATATVEASSAVLLGVRACELRARDYLDQVLLRGDFADPAYHARRERMTVVASDCVDCAESCFCTLVGGRPYATEGYDVNLTPLDDGVVVEVATDRGAQWLGDAASLPPARDEQLAARNRAREAMGERLRQQNAEFAFTADDSRQPKLPDDASPDWQRFAADCVECGACTNICPTCHCFYLYDQALGPDSFERVRTWDSCLFGTYHRMAGAMGMKPTPRPRLSSRLANRVLHKFAYSPQQYQRLGCVGCGRCIDACVGHIDIRRVVQELGR